jgi:large subunit ribosomal protein L25
MAETEVLQAEKRSGNTGTRSSRKLREQARIPGVVYGHQQETVAIAMSLEDFHRVLRHGARVLDLNLAGASEKVLIQDIQWDYLGKEILHVDFKRITVHERIEVEVAIVLRGEAPGVNAGGILEQVLHTLPISCPASAVPEAIRVNINELQFEGTIRVRDLDLPAGVQARLEEEDLVVHVRAPEEEPEPGEEGEQAEPEVIAREREEEEQGKS